MSGARISSEETRLETTNGHHLMGKSESKLVRYSVITYLTLTKVCLQWPQIFTITIRDFYVWTSTTQHDVTILAVSAVTDLGWIVSTKIVFVL